MTRKELIAKGCWKKAARAISVLSEEVEGLWLSRTQRRTWTWTLADVLLVVDTIIVLRNYSTRLVI